MDTIYRRLVESVQRRLLVYEEFLLINVERGVSQLVIDRQKGHKMLEWFRKLFGIHSPSKLLMEQTVKALDEAQIELKAWQENNKEDIDKFQKQFKI